jgi:hypothetical protein
VRNGQKLEERQERMRERLRAEDSSLISAAYSPAFAERHYTVAEVALLWNLSLDSVRRIFDDEPGVLVLCNDGATRCKRRYTTLRIPETVLKRVHKRMCNVER